MTRSAFAICWKRGLRAASGQARCRPADLSARLAARRSRPDLAGRHQRARQSKADAGSTDRQPMVCGDQTDGLEVAVEDRVDDRGSDALARKLGQTRSNGLRTARHSREIDETDLRLALAAQHAHQIEVVHRVERMILQGAFVQRHGADEQIALVDGAAGLRERRRHQHDRLATIGAQRVHHRADIAGIGEIEGRADLEKHVARAAPAQPFLRRPRASLRQAPPRSSGSLSDTTTASTSGSASRPRERR